MALNQGKMRQAMVEAPKAARDARALHWPLEFPDVMQRGGFDVVLGNPPWERIKLQEKEFFAALSPEIANAATAAARKRLIKDLASAQPGTSNHAMFEAFMVAKREAEATSEFVRVEKEDGGRFVLTGRGDVNTYALFAELFSSLTRLRAGVIVPTGIATDATTAPFFAHLVEKHRLARLVDFENRLGLFPAVHSAMKFTLLSLGREEKVAHFAFFLTAPAQLAEPERNFTLLPAEIAAINPNTKTAPVFRSRADAELTARIYRNAPVLIEESAGPSGNPWGVGFARLFDMSNDSHLFQTAAQLKAEGFGRDGTDWIKNNIRFVPLYEAKMGDFYDHRASGYGARGDERGNRVLPETTDAEHSDPSFEPEPFYWVLQREVTGRLKQANWEKNWLFGFKNVTAPTNQRTFICNIFPNWGVGNSMPLLLPLDKSACGKEHCLIANLSSLPFDFVARQKAGGINLNYFYVKQFPAFSPDFYTEPRLAFITPKVLELTYTSHSLAPFARDLGHDGPPFAWDEETR